MNIQSLPNFQRLWAIVISIALLTLLHSSQTSTARPLFTEVSGAIETDTTWTKANSPYIMTGDVTVNEGIHLTIEPGVVVKGNSGTDIDLRTDAKLSAIGTEAEPIVFTGYRDDEHGGDTNVDGQVSLPSAGEWSGISCAYWRNPNGQVDVQHALFRYASTALSTCGDLNVQNSTFEKISGDAVYIYHQTNISPTVVIDNNVMRDFVGQAVETNDISTLSGLDLTVTNNTITAQKRTNSSAGIALYGVGQGAIRDNTITMNGGNGIYVHESNDSLLIEENILTQDDESPLTYIGVYVDNAAPQLIKNQVSNFEMPVQIHNGYPQAVPTYRENVFENNRYSAIGVSGQILGGTWTEFADYPHIIVGRSASIAAGASLAIPAGMVIKFLDASESVYTSNGSLTVGNGAKLIAQGTETEPIIFTSTRDDEYGGDTNNNSSASLPVHGDWGNLSGSTSSTIQLDHVVIRYGSQIVVNGNLDVQNSTISNFYYDAINVTPATDTSPTVLISNTTFQYAIAQTTSNQAVSVSQTPGSLTIQNNQITGYNGISLSDVNTGQITENTIDLLNGNGQGVYGDSLGADVVFSDNTITRDSTQSYLGEGFELLNSSPQLINNRVSGFIMPVGITGGYPQTVPTYTDNQFENNQYNAIGVSGTINEATWTDLGGQTHFIASRFSVADGATLTLPAGTILKFASNYYGLSLGTGSSLVAVGTEDAPIILTSILDDEYGGDTNNDGQASSPSSGNWGGISSGAASTIQLQHVILRYSDGINATGNLTVQDSVLEENYSPGGITISPAANTAPDILIENSTFRKNYHGIYVQGQPKSLTIQQNQFEDNSNQQIRLQDVTAAQILDNTMAFSANSSSKGFYLQDVGNSVLISRNVLTRDNTDGYNSIGIENITSAPQLTENRISGFSMAVLINNGYPQTVPTYADNQLDGNQYKTIGVQGTIQEGTWTNFGEHEHFIYSGATVENGATLTIPAGTILKFSDYSRSSLSVGTGSSLIAQGTAEEPIVLTSIRDDAYGQDANSDGQESQPSKGNWGGLAGGTSSSIQLQHVILRYSDGVNATGNLTVQNSTIEETYSAITVAPAANSSPDILIEDSTLRDNYYHDIKVQGQPNTLVIQNNTTEEDNSSANLTLSDVTSGQITQNTFKRVTNSSGHSIYLENVGSEVIIQNNTLERDITEGYGFNNSIGIESKESTAQLTENQISGFHMPVGISGGYPTVMPTYTDNTFTGNHYSGVGVWGAIQGGTWDNSNGYVHFVGGSATLNQDEVLTIPAGTVVKMTSNAGLSFSSGADLVAIGTEDEPIVFTSILDDTYGGDTNNDGDESTPSSCSWNSITNPNGASTLQLQYVVIRYGCNGIYAVNDVSILDSKLEKNRYGIYFEPLSGVGSNFVVERNVIHGNSTGLYVRYLRSSNFTIKENSIDENSTGVSNADSSGSVDTTQNWWGAESGPRHNETNPDGTGNSVSDNVNYDPWTQAMPDIVTPTPIPTPTGDATATFTPSPSPIPTDTPVPTNTPILTDTPVPTETSLATDTPIPTDTPVSTATSTDIPPTFTPMPTLTPTLAPTLLPTATELAGVEEFAPTSTPTSEPVPDAFENNNNCAQAEAIQVGDVIQEHSFHVANDVDWMKFDGAKDRTYRIEVQAKPGSRADVNMELYPNCDGDPAKSWNESFTAGVRLDQATLVDGPVFIRLTNNDSTVAGNDVAYTLSVRDISPDTASQGALIVLAGLLKPNDGLQDNIHHITEQVYNLFRENGYPDEDIYYLATDATLDGYDAPATAANLQEAIVNWAVDKVSADEPLTLYLMDHGDINNFYINEPAGERLKPDELNDWLNQLEAKVPGLKTNIIIEACHSGSFIDGEDRVSRENRLVISSTNVRNVAFASADGAQFSDRFLMSLREGYGIQNSFWDARNSIRRHRRYEWQEPWIDMNGDGIPDEDSNAYNASDHNPGVDRLPADTWAPYIVQTFAPESIENGQGVIKAEVRDNEEVKRVWASVYAPSYVLPNDRTELVPENVPTFELSREQGDLFSGVYDEFDEQGLYSISVYAEDNDGLKARLSVLEIDTRPDISTTLEDPPADTQEIRHMHYFPFIGK